MTNSYFLLPLAHIIFLQLILKKKKFINNQVCRSQFLENMNSQQTQCQINPQRVFMILQCLLLIVISEFVKSFSPQMTCIFSLQTGGGCEWGSSSADPCITSTECSWPHSRADRNTHQCQCLQQGNTVTQSLCNFQQYLKVFR